MKNGKKIAIGLGVAGGISALIYFASKAKAAPPLVYICPYCGAAFDTYEELLAHIESEHPGEPPPPPVIGCTIIVTGCPSPEVGVEPGIGAVTKFNDGTGDWVICGEAGSWPFDMEVYRPFPLTLHLSCFRADGTFCGVLQFWSGEFYLENGKDYLLDVSTGEITGI